MIVVHDREVEALKSKFSKEKTNKFNLTTSPVMVYMDGVEIATILGLVEEHENRLENGEYRAGVREGYREAKKDMIKQTQKMRLRLP